MAPFYLRTVRGEPTITARPTTQQKFHKNKRTGGEAYIPASLKDYRASAAYDIRTRATSSNLTRVWKWEWNVNWFVKRIIVISNCCNLTESKNKFIPSPSQSFPVLFAKMPHWLPFFSTKISLVLVLPGRYDLVWFCLDQSYHTILYRQFWLFPGLLKETTFYQLKDIIAVEIPTCWRQTSWLLTSMNEKVN